MEEGRRKLGARADTALGGGEYLDRALRSCSRKPEDASIANGSRWSEISRKDGDTFVCQTWRTRLSTEARECENGASHY